MVSVYTNELSGTECVLYHHVSKWICIDIYADSAIYTVYKLKKIKLSEKS